MFWFNMSQNATTDARLFLAAVPDAEASARIQQLGQTLKRAHRFSGRLIDPDRLHISLLFLGEPSEYMVRIACEAAADVRVPPFEVRFDRSVSFQGRPGNRPFVLVGDDGLDGVRSLRRALGATLARKGLKRLARREFTPHITLLYAERSVDEYPIAPIRWTVNEFVLIHSMRGHTHLARWALRY
jgi:2'-5' RNA ligase